MELLLTKKYVIFDEQLIALKILLMLTICSFCSNCLCDALFKSRNGKNVYGGLNLGMDRCDHPLDRKKKQKQLWKKENNVMNLRCRA